MVTDGAAILDCTLNVVEVLPGDISDDAGPTPSLTDLSEKSQEAQLEETVRRLQTDFSSRNRYY